MFELNLITNSLIILISTVIGGFIALLNLRFSEKFIDASLGFSAGAMLSIAYIELLAPYLETIGLKTLIGFITGVSIIYLIHTYAPHEHLMGKLGLKQDKRVLSTLLLAIAVILHNIPEGLAVGSSTLINSEIGFKIALSIGLQDLPEGYAVALPFILSKKPKQALVLSTLSAVSETLSVYIAIPLGIVSTDLLVHTATFSAGAMIYIVSHELIPETHSHGFEKEATLSLILGAISTFLLSIYL